MNKTEESIMDDLMEKVSDDVSDAINRTMQLVSPDFMLPITNRASRTSIAASAMIYDLANGVNDANKIPTHESMVLATLVILHSLLDSDSPWDAAVADLKKHFPDAKVPQVSVIDRRRRKRKQAS